MSSKFDLIKQKIKEDKVRILTIVALLILIPVLIGGITVLQVNQKNESAQIEESKYLYVTDYQIDHPSTLKFEFSDPVDLGMLEHHFAISPEIEGSLQKDGIGNKKFKFVAKENLPENSYISITILGGLTSENRKPFIEDFYMSFDNTTNVENLFSKDGISGKVMSFDGNKPVELTVQKYTRASDMTLNLYKSDNASLLNFLSYREVEKGEDYKYKEEEFIRKNIPQNKSNLVTTKKITTKSSNEKFNLDSGVYYLEATDGKSKIYGASFIIVSKNGVALRQDDKKIILGTFNLSNGNKQNTQAEAVFYNLKDSPTRIGETKYDELERSFDLPYSQRVDAALVTIGGETVFIPLKLPLSLADIRAREDLDKKSKIFLYTERPIYKPGDTVFFRGIVRVDSDSLYKMPSNDTPVYITKGYIGDEKAEKITVLTDGKGVFSGNFVIPKDSQTTQQYGSESIYANLNNSSDNYYDSTAYAYYTVAKYVKPDFELKVEAQNSESLRHENPKFVISGKYFTGKPMANQEVEFTALTNDYYESEKIVYNKNFNINAFGGMCGGGVGFGDDYYGSAVGESKKIKLDENGKAVVEFPADSKALLSQSVTITANKKDDSGNEITGAATSIRHAGAFNLFLIPSSDNYKPGDNISIPFYTEELSGEKVANKEFSYRLIENTYSGERTNEKEIMSGKTNSDENGKGIVTFNLPATLTPESYSYVIIEGTDRFGNKVENRKSLYITDKNTTTVSNIWQNQYDTFLKISSAQNSYKLGQSINLIVNSPEDLDALLTFERGRVYNPQLLHLQKGNNKVSIPVTAEHSPSITPVFSFFYNGRYYSEGLSLNVPSMHKLLNISITSNKSEYKKGENAEVKIKVRDASGNPVSAQMSLGIVDKAIYALRKSATPAVHSSFYYFRPRTTNASSSLTWVGSYGGGGGGGGGGPESLNRLVDTLYWNPNVQTDSSGEVTLSVPLGQSQTIWKALVVGSDESTDVGQDDTEFLVN